MDDTTERELRNSIETLRRDVAKVWTTLRELQSVLWGDNIRRDDGLKKDLVALEARVGTLESVLRDLEARITHYIDAGRAETCLGLKALAEHEQAEGQLYEEGQEEDTNVKIAAMNNGVEEKKVKWQLVAAVVTAAFLFAGQVITASQASATQREIAAMAQTLEARR